VAVLSQKTTVVKYNERIDQLALRTLGNTNRYREILALNPFLNIWNPQQGMTVLLPE
jgi:hypothetical protein